MAEPQQTTEEMIDHDDICHICHLLLLHPVITSCNHTFCETCFSHWADVSISQMIRGLDIDEQFLMPPDELETRCPMCRTLTTAKLDKQLARRLKSEYPATYKSRKEELSLEIQDEDGALIEPLTLYIGNEHKLVRHDSGDKNKHEWNFFVRLSRTDVVEEIQVFLHPTFRNPKIVLTHAPYSIRRVGWGVFTIFVNIILKVGYSWISPEAEDTADGAPGGKLPLEWHLDFNGRGSQGRCRFKIRKEKPGQDTENERQSERTRRAWNRQRLRDPDYVPPPEV